MTKNKFTPNKPNLWAVRLGYFHGQGLSSISVAEALEDGTGPATVRTMVQRAGLPMVGERMASIPIIVPSWQRDILFQHAKAHQLDVAEYCTRLIYDAGITSDLYDAVTDGRYEVE